VALAETIADIGEATVKSTMRASVDGIWLAQRGSAQQSGCDSQSPS
jgi:hypothetical protein